MDGPRIPTRRLDATGSPTLTRLAQTGAAAFGWTAELALDRRLAELLRLRVSQINNCAYCLDLHHRVARDVGIPEAKIRLLTAWWETGLFTDAERAALAYAEALTRISDTTAGQAFQPHHDALATHFGETEMLEIVGVVLNMNLWTRLKLAEGAMPTEGS
jgi:AhpD family alkylhydroperoxidase